MEHLLHPDREVLVELEVWAREGLSVGEPVCLMEEVSSSAGAHGYGGLEARDDDQVSGDDGQVEEELGKLLDSEMLRLGLSTASALFPRCSFGGLLSPALLLFSSCSAFSSCRYRKQTVLRGSPRGGLLRQPPR